MFYCREDELRSLNRRYSRGGMACIIVYGRKRVGKTALISAFIRGKSVIYFSVLNAAARENLNALSQAIYAYQGYAYGEREDFPSYEAAFAEITTIARQTRTVLIIDELPVLLRSDNSLAALLQRMMEQEWKDSRLFLVFLSSTVNYKEKHVLVHNHSLLDTQTAQFRLEPLTYLNAALLNPALPPEENLQIYGVTGGIPYYIQKLDVRLSVRQALLENLFQTSAYLFEEPDAILKQDLREPALYNSIIRAVAEGADKLNDISTVADVDTATCSKYIRILIELGMIERVEPIIDQSKRKKRYIVSDIFFRFWYRFVPRNLTSIQLGTFPYHYDSEVGSHLQEYMQKIFIEICRQYLLHYARNLPVAIVGIGEWWGMHPRRKEEVSLDIVALGAGSGDKKTGRKFIIGSCRYENERTGAEELERMKEYASLFTGKKDECWYYIFSRAGFTFRLTERQKAGEVTLVTLKELYRPS